VSRPGKLLCNACGVRLNRKSLHPAPPRLRRPCTHAAPDGHAGRQCGHAGAGIALAAPDGALPQQDLERPCAPLLQSQSGLESHDLLAPEPQTECSEDGRKGLPDENNIVEQPALPNTMDTAPAQNVHEGEPQLARHRKRDPGVCSRPAKRRALQEHAIPEGADTGGLPGAGLPHAAGAAPGGCFPEVDAGQAPVLPGWLPDALAQALHHAGAVTEQKGEAPPLPPPQPPVPRANDACTSTRMRLKQRVRVPLHQALGKSAEGHAFMPLTGASQCVRNASSVGALVHC
jgi:hypothetical protein